MSTERPTTRAQVARRLARLEKRIRREQARLVAERRERDMRKIGRKVDVLLWAFEQQDAAKVKLAEQQAVQMQCGVCGWKGTNSALPEDGGCPTCGLYFGLEESEAK